MSGRIQTDHRSKHKTSVGDVLLVGFLHKRTSGYWVQVTGKLQQSLSAPHLNCLFLTIEEKKMKYIFSPFFLEQTAKGY